MQLRLCFVAPSEFGKNTAVSLLKTKFNVFNIKIASPLYKLQRRFYEFIGKKMSGEQDGELLQFLGKKIRKESPDFLLNVFKKRFNDVKNFEGIVTNDDCRPPDYSTLKNLGFIFIKINGFKRNRLDHTKADPLSPLEWKSSVPCDYSVDNLGNLEQYSKNLFKLMDFIIKEREEKHERDLSI